MCPHLAFSNALAMKSQSNTMLQLLQHKTIVHINSVTSRWMDGWVDGCKNPLTCYLVKQATIFLALNNPT